MEGERRGGRRADVTRRRHGDDFYARIGRKSWELRRRARDGHPAALETLERRRAARDGRAAAWRDTVEAREAVALLREELATRALADAEPARATMARRFDYAARLRAELAAAEERLAALQAAHRRLLDDLGAG